MGAGPGDAPYVDAALADKGKSVWAAECINCHGTQARGTDNGPNLTRSLVVLRDRYGSELGPFLKRGHKMQSGASASTLTDDQITNLAHFLRQRVNDSFRGSPIFQPQNVLTGDAAAGAAARRLTRGVAAQPFLRRAERARRCAASLLSWRASLGFT